MLSISGCLSQAVYLRLSISQATVYLRRLSISSYLSHDVYLRLSISGCLSQAVYIRLSFSGCLSQAVYQSGDCLSQAVYLVLSNSGCLSQAVYFSLSISSSCLSQEEFSVPGFMKVSKGPIKPISKRPEKTRHSFS